MFWTNPEFCKWCSPISRITGLLSFAGDSTHACVLGLLPRSPCQRHHHPARFPPQGNLEMQGGSSVEGRGAWHWHCCGGGCRSLLPPLSSRIPWVPKGLWAPLPWAPAAFAQGHSLAELALPLSHHSTPWPFLSLPPAAGPGPGKGCWTLWKFLEGQKQRLTSRALPDGRRSRLTGRAHPCHGRARQLPPQVVGKPAGQTAR